MAKDITEEDIDEKKSKFNISFRHLLSLRYLLDECNEYSSQCYQQGMLNINALKQWELKLQAIKREIWPKLSKDERNKIGDAMKDIRDITVLSDNKTEEGVEKNVNVRNFNKKWHLLDKLEMLMRSYADQKGLGVTDAEDSTASMDD